MFFGVMTRREDDVEKRTAKRGMGGSVFEGRRPMGCEKEEKVGGRGGVNVGRVVSGRDGGSFVSCCVGGRRGVWRNVWRGRDRKMVRGTVEDSIVSEVLYISSS